LTYQWKKNSVDIAGANGATLSLMGVQDGDAGSYTVVVTNAVNSVTSDPATLVVTHDVVPSITTPPVSQTVNTGDRSRSAWSRRAPTARLSMEKRWQ
jgi:hypothetical protein